MMMGGGAVCDPVRSIREVGCHGVPLPGEGQPLPHRSHLSLTTLHTLHSGHMVDAVST